MIYIDSTQNPSGAYPNPKNQPFPGCIALTDEQAEVFLSYNGFVTMTQEDNSVTVEPNVDAWEAWKSSLPEPEPEPTPEPEDETSVWNELDAAYQEGVNSAYDQ